MARLRGQDIATHLRGHVTRSRLVLLAIFAVSRVGYWLAGVRFDASGLDFSSQLVDQSVLRDRLVESVWYLHSQPPAFNLFVGAVLRWSPFGPVRSFHLVYLGLGVVLVLALHDLVRRFGLRSWVAIAAAAVIACNPTTVLFENWLSYEYPVAVLLVVLTDLAARYATKPSAARLVAATSVAAAATLTRSLLHPLWLLAIFGCLVVYRRPPKRSALLYGALPLVLVALVMVKNQVVFGTPQLSSWFGFNANRVVVAPLTEEQTGILAAEGFTPAQPEPCVRRHPDVPAVAEPTKRVVPAGMTEPILNFNDECVIGKFGALEDDARTVGRAHPKWVLRNIGGGTELWSTPASLNPFVYNNREKIGTVDEVYRRTVLMDLAWDPTIPVPNGWAIALSAPDHRFHISLTLVWTTALCALAAIVSAVRWRRRDSRSMALLVGGGTVAFVTISTNVFEYGENNRIRFVVEPLTLALAAVIVGLAVQSLLRRRRATTVDAGAATDAETETETEKDSDSETESGREVSV